MYWSAINIKIDLYLHEFWGVVVKGTTKEQQGHTLWGCNSMNKNMGLGLKLESNGCENHQKSEGMVPIVNLNRVNNLL